MVAARPPPEDPRAGLGRGQRQAHRAGRRRLARRERPKPDPSYLTPAEGADRLQTIHAAAPCAASGGRRAGGPRFTRVATEWLEPGQRKRGLKHSTLKDYRYLINTHLLPNFGELEVRTISRQDIERWHSGYERTRTAGQALMVLGAILSSVASSSPPTRSTASSATPSVTPATTTSTAAKRSTPSSAQPPTTRTRHLPHRRPHRPEARRAARPALVRHQLPRPGRGHPRARQHLLRPDCHPEIGQSPRCPHGRRGRPSASPRSPTASS